MGQCICGMQRQADAQAEDDMIVCVFRVVFSPDGQIVFSVSYVCGMPHGRANASSEGALIESGTRWPSPDDGRSYQGHVVRLWNAHTGKQTEARRT